jgi:hypothetical protein
MTTIPTSPADRKIAFIKDAALAVLLALVVALFAAYAYGLTNAQRWAVPPGYVSGDGYWSLNVMKSAARGELLPFKQFVIKNLGAPYEANYSDWPIGLTLEYLPGGILVNLLGLAIGTNIYLLLCHSFSGLCMFICMRWMGALRVWAFVAAVAFGLSPFIFYRGLAHTMLANIVWMVPLICAAAWYMFRRRLYFENNKKLWICLLFSFFIGAHSLYFSAPYLWILMGAALFWLMRDRKTVVLLPYIANGVFFLAGFFTSNLLYFINAFEHGSNKLALISEYQHLQTAALKPIEMFLPGSGSGIPVLDALSRFHENKDFFRINVGASESMSAYLGLLGCLGLILLVGFTIFYAATNRQNKISGWFWLALFLIAFSVVSGLNSILGLGGIYVLRGSNRYSIYIGAIALIYLALFLSTYSHRIGKAWRFLLAVFLLAIPSVETILPRLRGAELHRPGEDVVSWKKGSKQWDSRAEAYHSDVEFAKKLEALLPAEAMVFNYPFINLPQEGAYIFYRPAYFTEKIRYSFGNIFGRAKDSWLKSTQNLEPEEMVETLKGYGFSGILVYHGPELPGKYKEQVARLLHGLEQNFSPTLQSPARDFTFFAFPPHPNPRFPAVPPMFVENWWSEEAQPSSTNTPLPGNHQLWRWASRKTASLEIFNEQKVARDFILSGEVIGMQTSNFEILVESNVVFSGSFSPLGTTSFSTIPAKLEPQKSIRIMLKSECQPAFVDGLKFNFGIANLEVNWINAPLSYQRKK